MPDEIEFLDKSEFTLNLKDCVELQSYAVAHVASLRGILAKCEKVGAVPDPVAEKLITDAINDAQRQADTFEDILTSLIDGTFSHINVILF